MPERIRPRKGMLSVRKATCQSRYIVLVCFVLLAALRMPPMAPELQRVAGLNASAELLTFVDRHPDRVVELIVQKAGPEQIPEATIVRMGGRLVRSLSIINGFAAQLPASRVRDLAQTPSVRWLSLDAPLLQADGSGSAMDYMGAWECSGASPTHYAIDTTNPHSGTYNVKLIATAQTPARCEQRLRVYPNTTYNAIAMLKASQTDIVGTLETTILDSQGQTIANEHTSAVVNGAPVYTPARTTFTTGAQAAFLSIVVSVKTPVGALYLDDVSLRRVSDPEGMITNLVINPSFEYGLASGWLCPLQGAQRVVQQPANSSIEPFDDHELHLQARNDHPVRCEQGVNVEGGQRYRLAAHIRAGTAYNSAGASIGAFVGEMMLGLATSTGSTERDISTILTVPADRNNLTIYVQIEAGHSSSVYFDDAVLQKCLPSADPSICLTTASPNILANPDFEQQTMSLNAFPKILQQDRLPDWLNGQGITVAVVDSGIATHPDLSWDALTGSRIISEVAVLSGNTFATPTDEHGHGSHVAGIIAGNGATSHGIAVGVAPQANLVSLKIFGRDGRGSTRDFVAALEWIYQNRARYNIRVVNLSVSSATTEHYSTNPLSAAMEVLWHNGIVVVVCAGNNGTPGVPVPLHAPANDPLVITVGATWDKGTPEIEDDLLADYSAFGTITTTNRLNIPKPDLVVPGSRIISLLASDTSTVKQMRPYQTARGFSGAEHYYRMSGTSMAAPIVTGAVALLLQNEPGLTPTQVKHRLMTTARPLLEPDPNNPLAKRVMAGTGAGYVDLYAAIIGPDAGDANWGVPLNQRVYNQGTNPALTWSQTDWSNISWANLDQGGRGMGGSGRGMGGSGMQINVDWEPPPQ